MPPFSRNWAFFLDLDGTLLEIEETPDAVGAGPDENRLLKELLASAGGAVAVISGRALARIDQILAPLVLPAAGQHGAERRDANGLRHRHRFPPTCCARWRSASAALPRSTRAWCSRTRARAWRCTTARRRSLRASRRRRCATPPGRSARRSRCRTARWWS